MHVSDFPGEIERLQKHWLARACHSKKETGVSSHTLGILNFTSAFVLLGTGVVLGVLILSLEHMYFRFGRKSLRKLDKNGCCSLVSLVSILNYRIVCMFEPSPACWSLFKRTKLNLSDIVSETG